MLLLRLSHGISSGCHHATPISKKVLDFPLLREGGILLLLRLSQGISSGCHHATPTPYFFGFVIIVARVFLQVATMPPLHLWFFDVTSVGKEIEIARGHYASASSYLEDCFKVQPCPPYTLEKSKLFAIAHKFYVPVSDTPMEIGNHAS